jgi:rhodanese-related sulfurtransferase
MGHLNRLRIVPLGVACTLIASPGSAKTLPGVLDSVWSTTEEKIPEVSTAELKHLLETGSAVVFDARSPREYATGHIPGALNVPGKAGLPPSQYTADMREVIRAVDGNTSARIILYCNGPFCGRSVRLAEDLLKAGFANVRRYQLGMPVWRALGGVQQIELDALRDVLERDRTAIVLDARGTTSVPGSRGLILADVRNAKDDGRLPMDDHHTRIIVIGAHAAQARAVAEGVAADAFDNVSFFAGDPSSLHGAAPVIDVD